MDIPKLAGLPLLRQRIDSAFDAFRSDPTAHNRALLEVALSVYQIAHAPKCANGANLHQTIRSDGASIRVAHRVVGVE